MFPLQQRLQEGLTRIAVSRRITVLEDQPNPAVAAHPAAIVSRVPDARVETGRGHFAGRRKKLQLDLGPVRMTLRARHRPVPLHLVAHGRPSGWPTDYMKRRVPLCSIDRATRTVHLLVDVDTAEVLGSSPGVDPAALLVDVLLAEPLGVLLNDDHEPLVGAELRDAIRSLLRTRAVQRRRLLTSELGFLERLTASERMPDSLARRIAALRRSLGTRAGEDEREEAERRRTLDEIDRLRLLVSSRVCAALRFGRDEIAGLLNPRQIANRWLVAPIAFRLQIGRCGHGPALFLWDPARPEPCRKRRRCLGSGGLFFDSYAAAGDVFGLIDVILNFIETNEVGLAPLEDPSRQRRSGTSRLTPAFLDAGR